MKNLRATVAVAAVLLSCAPSAMATVIINTEGGGTGPFSAVFPMTIETNPDVGDTNIYVGRINVINGIIFAPLNGELIVNAQPGPNAISTNEAINVGILRGTRGVLTVDGQGDARSATASASLLNVGGQSPAFSRASGAPLSGTGYGEVNVLGGARLDIDNNTSPFGFGAVLVGGSGANNMTDTNGIATLDGVLTVSGAGSLATVDGVFLGNPSVGTSGELRITNGGRLEAVKSLIDAGFDIGNGQIGISENSRGIVSGVGSTLTTNSLVVGTGAFPGDTPNNLSNKSGSFEVSNQAQVLVDTMVNELGFGDRGLVVGAGAVGDLTVRGSGTSLRVENSSVGFGGQTQVLIGTSIADFDSNTNTRTFSAGNGTMTATDSANVFVGGDIFVGGANDLGDSPLGNEPNSIGRLVVENFATVDANNIFVDTLGTLSGSNGFVNSNVVLRGGTLAPGSSPGAMFIGGDLLLQDGMLDIEIAGANVGEYDQLIIGGDFQISDRFLLGINFIDSFVPQIGDVFDIFEFAQSPLIDFSKVNIQFGGLGLNPNISFFGSDPFSLSFRVDSFDQVPTPSALVILITGLAGLGLARRRQRHM